MNTGSSVLCTAALVSLAGCAGQPQSASRLRLEPLADFCGAAQQIMAGTSLRSTNVVHSDFQAFVLSKPKVRPLETEQFHWYEGGDPSRLKMISCKMKTTDHLRTEYGDTGAGAEGLCADINRRSLDEAWRGLRRGHRGNFRYRRGTTIVFDPEEITNLGPEWLKPHEIAWEDGAGVLHVQSRAMRNDWLDPRYLQAPPQFRGTRYCHLMAPDYFRRLLTGASTAPRARGEAVSPAQAPAIR